MPKQVSKNNNSQTILDLQKALAWALGVITICEKNAPNIDWSIGHFGRKERAKKLLGK